MAWETTSASRVGREYILATGSVITAVGDVEVPPPAMASSRKNSILLQYRSRSPRARSCLPLGCQVQPFMDGVQRQFQAIGDAQFVEDVVEVVLDGLLADEHLLRHFFILVSLGHQLHDFP